MLAVAAFIVCGVTAFYTKRAEHGRTAEGATGVLDRGESRGTSAARCKVAHARGVEHDGPEIFQAAGIG